MWKVNPYFLKKKQEQQEEEEEQQEEEEISKEKQIIEKINKKENELVILSLETEKPKIIALDVVIGLACFLILLRFIILPFGFGFYRNSTVQLFDVLHKHFSKVLSPQNIIFLILFIAIVAICFSFKNNDFKKTGLILLIAYITSLAVEAKLFVTGAIISGIATYIYIRVIISQEYRKHKFL